jgi:hypothetical protein
MENNDGVNLAVRTCLTRRLASRLNALGDRLAPLLWPSRLLIAASLVAAGYWCYQTQPRLTLIILLGACIIGLPIVFAIDAPMWILFALAWVALSITAVIDVATHTAQVMRPRNRIALWILGIDVIVAALVLWTIYVF